MEISKIISQTSAIISETRNQPIVNYPPLWILVAIKNKQTVAARRDWDFSQLRICRPPHLCFVFMIWFLWMMRSVLKEMKKII